jgi:hypothetical protein
MPFYSRIDIRPVPEQPPDDPDVALKRSRQ